MRFLCIETLVQVALDIFLLRPLILPLTISIKDYFNEESTSIRFILLDISNRCLSFENFWSHTAYALAAGGCAGSTTLCFVYPLDFIRTRLSVDIGRSRETREYKVNLISH